jgi:hypothetical protein
MVVVEKLLAFLGPLSSSSDGLHIVTDDDHTHDYFFLLPQQWEPLPFPTKVRVGST